MISQRDHNLRIMALPCGGLRRMWCLVLLANVGLLCTAIIGSEPDLRGPLRVHPDNRRYFTNGSGKTIYVTGSHHWGNLQDGYNPEVTPFDYERYLDLLQKHSHNFIRLWAWEHVASEASWHYEHKKQLFDPLPYARTGPGLALDGKPKLDLTKFNNAYFDRLRQRVVAARQRRVYVAIMLFQGVASTGPRTWPGHVFNKDNNVNGLDGNGAHTQTLKFPAVTEIQKAYIRRVIDTVNDLDNVLYEIANEAHAGTAAWQYEMIRYIKSYEQDKPKQHPVGMTCRADEPNNEVLWLSPADWVSPGTYKLYAHDPPAADGRKVSLLDTDHVFGVGGDRRWIWKAFTRGHNPIYMDPLWGYIPDKGLWKGQAERGEGARVAMGQTRRMAERVNLVAMVPRGDLASSKYCLANPGVEYVVYLPDGGQVTVDLSTAKGMLQAEWIDPVEGTVRPAAPVQGGGERRLQMPFNGDAVLHLWVK